MAILNRPVRFVSAKKVYTGEGPPCTSFSIDENGKILELEPVGEASDGDNSTLDVKEYVVVPGFIDSHLHCLDYGQTLQECDLKSVSSVSELVEMIRSYAATKGPEAWIIGSGWDQGRFAEGRYPRASDLDDACGGRPALLFRACYHLAVANSKALALASIVAGQVPPVEGGSIDVDESGEPTGLLREAAVQVVNRLVPPLSPEQRRAALSSAFQRLVSFGVTTAHTIDLKYDCMPEYRAMLADGDLPLRLNVSIIHDLMDKLEPGAASGVGDDFIRWGRIKLFADGSLGGETAALRSQYQSCHHCGSLLHSPDELSALVQSIHARGWQIETHAIGDQAAEVVIAAYERLDCSIRPDPRPILAHAQVLDAELIKRMARAKVVATIQPLFINSDWHWAEERLGRERLQYSYAWRSLLEAGVPCAGGSDAPVESPNALLGIHAAVNRQDVHGEPPAGWLPDQKLSVEQALALFTSGSAYAEYREGRKGVLKPGALADFVVLDQDPFEVEAAHIRSIKVIATVVGAHIKYHR